MEKLRVPASIAAGVVSTLLLGSVFFLVTKFCFPPPPPPLSLPDTLTVQEKSLVTIPVVGEAKQIKWLCLANDAKLIPWPDGTQALFQGQKAGTYHVAVVGLDKHSKLTEPSVCCITVQGAEPPGPGPNPTPNDPLVNKLQAAYAAEMAPDKAKQLAALGELYAQGSSAATSRNDLTTWGAFFNALSDVAHSVGVNGQIMGVQGVVQSELQRALPTKTDQAFDATSRNLASTTLTRIASAIKAVKP